jgi:hypothetical protein
MRKSFIASSSDACFDSLFSYTTGRDTEAGARLDAELSQMMIEVLGVHLSTTGWCVATAANGATCAP